MLQQSYGVLNDKKIEAMTTLTKLSDDEKSQYARILRRFEYAKEQRNTRSRFFDGMSYVEDHITNENTANTFITPRANDSEVEVNTGTSEKKIDAIKNEMLSVEFKSRASAYDEFDRKLNELGDDISDMAECTYGQERDPLRDDTNMEILDQLLTQRGVYIQETLSTRTFRRGQQKITQCQSRVISGLKVFPGSLTLSPFRWNLQPFIVLYDRFDYETARTLFQHLPNFKKVVPQGYSSRSEYLGEQYEYRFGTLSDGEVEVITYESLPDDEYQIIINGVPMFPPNYKLPWSYPGYDVQFFVNKPMSIDWLYGRPVTAQAKTLQAFSTEYLRLLVRKAQQAVEAPLGVEKAGKIYTKDMWNPGAITQGLKKDAFHKLIDHEGVSNADFAMYNLIEQKIEEFIGTPNIAQGLSSSRDISATEVLTISKQFIKSLGTLFFARLRIERTLLEMRTYNILDNYLTPIRKRYNEKTATPFDVYRTFEIDQSQLENNQIGKKTIYMVSDDPSPEDIRKVYEFEKNQEMIGNAVRIHFLNIKKLKQLPKYWKFEAYMQDRDGTTLDKVLYQDQLNQAANIASLEMSPAGQILNMGIIKENYERKWKARDWFQKRPPGMELMNPQANPEMAMDMESKLAELEGMKNTGSLGSQTIQGLQGAARGAQKAVETL